MDDGHRRTLHFDRTALQSSMVLDDPVRLDLEYSQAMMCGLLFRPDPGKVLLIGLGGGSLVRFLLDHFPGLEIEVAEVSQQVIDIARRFFFLPGDGRLRVHALPGEELVARQRAGTDRYDLILVDAFDENGPAQPLLTDRFQDQCHSLLGDRGVFVMNFWNRPQDGFMAHWRRLSARFGPDRTYRLSVSQGHTNGIVFGLSHPLKPADLMRLKPTAVALSRKTGVNFVRLLRRLHEQSLAP